MLRHLATFLIVFFITLASSSAHVVDQLFADFRIDKKTNSWNVIIRIDAGISLPEFRDDDFAPQPRRDWLLALSPEKLEEVRRGTEQYLRNCLSFSWQRGGQSIPADFTIHFPAWDSHPPHFNEEFSDTGYAYFDCILHAPIPPESGTLHMHVTDGKFPNFTIAHEGASVEQFLVTYPGSSTELWKSAGYTLPTKVDGFFSFLHFGYRHVIPEGWDHVLFIAALCCLSIHWRPLLTQSLVFTAAHTITLGLSIAGTIPPAPDSISTWIEIFIAATIVYVAVENIISKKIRAHRLIMVFCFGLIHGLGFASVLGEKIRDSGSIAQPLISTNLGVELGQLSVIAIMLIALLPLRRLTAFPIILKSISSIIALIGCYWVIQRFIGWADFI